MAAFAELTETPAFSQHYFDAHTLDYDSGVGSKIAALRWHLAA